MSLDASTLQVTMYGHVFTRVLWIATLRVEVSKVNRRPNFQFEKVQNCVA